MDWAALKSAAKSGTLAKELQRQLMGSAPDLSSLSRNPGQRRFISENLESFRQAMPTLRSGRASLKSAKATASKAVSKAKSLVSTKSMTRSK